MAKLRVDGIHIVIGDSDPLARRVVREALQDRSGFVIPGEASTGPEAVELCLYYRPQVALLEVSLPEMDGLAATRQILAAAPEVRVLIFSWRDAEETQLEALRAGASGFLSKDVRVETVPRAVQSLVRGEAVISRTLTMRLIDRLRRLPEGGAGMRPVRSPLTSREWEVLDLLSQDKDTKDIAETLVLSEETVYTHAKNLLRKLDVHSRREAIEAAQRLRHPVVGLTAGESNDDAASSADTTRLPPAQKESAPVSSSGRAR
ncbi:MAG TPA: response regulator transcription factor [Solirubrobacterales bacterium]|nr:response regulator transcription factor [Solirubrobacterales bacterium]